jgi:hypothetical protein
VAEAVSLPFGALGVVSRSAINKVGPSAAQSLQIDARTHQSQQFHRSSLRQGRLHSAGVEALRRTEHTSDVYVRPAFARSLGSGLLVLIATWVVAKPGSSPRVSLGRRHLGRWRVPPALFLSADEAG